MPFWNHPPGASTYQISWEFLTVHQPPFICLLYHFESCFLRSFYRTIDSNFNKICFDSLDRSKRQIDHKLFKKKLYFPNFLQRSTTTSNIISPRWFYYPCVLERNFYHVYKSIWRISRKRNHEKNKNGKTLYEILHRIVRHPLNTPGPLVTFKFERNTVLDDPPLTPESLEILTSHGSSRITRHFRSIRG